jgi:hypothetical protein
LGFSDSVKIAAQSQKSQINDKIVSIAQQLFTAIVVATPVNNNPHADKRGELKNNWFVGQGIGNYNSDYSSTFDSEGSQSLSQVATIRGYTGFVNKDDELSFTNSVPYGYMAEVTGWLPPHWSGNVGPYAMVRNSMIEVVSKIK